MKVGTAHQYIVREQRKQEELVNPYWTNLDLNLKNTTVRQITIQDAKKIIERYEYLGCLAAVNWLAYGIFFKDKDTGEETCGGAVVYGQEYAENQGVWDKYGFTGKIILLNRGVCVHWTPINTNSKLIMESIKLLPKKYEVVTCTTDPDAGEIGTIYQACNFYYVGAMRKNKTRTNIKINGKLYGSRTIRQKYGTMAKDRLPDLVKSELGENAIIEFVTVHAKHRYFYFNCGKKKKKEYLNGINDLIKPYPKRK
jgi:hypothetical protein